MAKYQDRFQFFVGGYVVAVSAPVRCPWWASSTADTAASNAAARWQHPVPAFLIRDPDFECLCPESFLLLQLGYQSSTTSH